MIFIYLWGYHLCGSFVIPLGPNFVSRVPPERIFHSTPEALEFLCNTSKPPKKKLIIIIDKQTLLRMKTRFFLFLTQTGIFLNKKTWPFLHYIFLTFWGNFSYLRWPIGVKGLKHNFRHGVQIIFWPLVKYMQNLNRWSIELFRIHNKVFRNTVFVVGQLITIRISPS